MTRRLKIKVFEHNEPKCLNETIEEFLKKERILKPSLHKVETRSGSDGYIIVTISYWGSNSKRGDNGSSVTERSNGF